MPRIPTIDFTNVREFYDRQIGGTWFDQGAMRFFKTKLPRVAYATDAGLLFITAETSPSGDTRYSVRRQKVSGDIDTVGEFHCVPQPGRCLGRGQAFARHPREGGLIMWFTSSSSRIELQMTLAQAQSCAHPGDNEPAVLRLRQEPKIRRQLAKIDPATLRNELSEYGAWDDEELADHDMNLTRLLWLACHDITEENT